MTEDHRPDIGRLAVAWYSDRARDLPWRRTKDPYAVWVSEIMLQQTTVATVAPRFAAFLLRFPNLVTMAQASEEELLEEVVGLGYYRRFRAMKKTADLLVSESLDSLPTDYRALRELPGIGDYTAGAVASIAFNEPVAAIDGNAIRVLSRLLARGGLHVSAASKRALAVDAVAMIPSGRASEFTQALFDLGATVCRPREPDCDACPVQTHCAALQQDRIDEFPQLAKRRESIPRLVAVAWIQDESHRRVLLQRRTADASRMPGFWQLPEIWLAPSDDAKSALAEMLSDLGTDSSVGEELARARHSITHHRLDCRLHAVTIGAGRLAALAAREEFEFFSIDELQAAAAPLSTISRKLWLQNMKRQTPSP
ncbi:MAG: NUDIX domain-containing protein [Planctomycetota bacterium]